MYTSLMGSNFQCSKNWVANGTSRVFSINGTALSSHPPGSGITYPTTVVPVALAREHR